VRDQIVTRCHFGDESMVSSFRFVFVVFYFSAILLFAVYLRSAEDRAFYKLCTEKAEQSRLKQELWRKQLQVETLINPAALSQKLGEQ